MSSTLRGYDRHKTDFYVTPQEHVELFLNKFKDNHLELDLSQQSFLDPCSGGDSKHDASYVKVLTDMFDPDVLTSVDIRKDSHAQLKLDFLKSTSKDICTHDIVISNPPFKYAKEFITKSLEYVHNGGYVIMLLRLNFLGSKGRFEFFKDNMPTEIYVHHQRMSFTDDGGTDSIEYAHFVWKKGTSCNDSKLFLI